MGTRGWSDEVRDFALDRASKGDSGTSIANQIFKTFKVHKTRNAVIGLVFRAGKHLHSTNSATQAAKQGRLHAAAFRARKGAGRQARPRLSCEPLPPPCETDTARVAFADLDERKITVRVADGTTRIVREHCKFPVLQEPAGPYVKQFCGDQRALGSPYCQHHSSRAYQLPQPRYLPRAAGRAGAFDTTKAIDELESA